MSRKICEYFSPKEDGNCLFNQYGFFCRAHGSNSEAISMDKDPNYFCPHSEQLIEHNRKKEENKDKWTNYWESKMSGKPMKEDLPKDLIDKLDKAFEEWEKNKEK